mgnify:CR=1 FL=1
MRRRLTDADYKEIKTPQVVDRKLWEASGHWDKYRENLFLTEIDAEARVPGALVREALADGAAPRDALERVAARAQGGVLGPWPPARERLGPMAARPAASGKRVPAVSGLRGGASTSPRGARGCRPGAGAGVGRVGWRRPLSGPRRAWLFLGENTRKPAAVGDGRPWSGGRSGPQSLCRRNTDVIPTQYRSSFWSLLAC